MHRFGNAYLSFFFFFYLSTSYLLLFVYICTYIHVIFFYILHSIAIYHIFHVINSLYSLQVSGPGGGGDCGGRKWRW